METSLCERGHEVWWAELNGEKRAFVRFTQGYDLVRDESGAFARAVRYCYRLHSDICDARAFTEAHRVTSPAGLEL